MTIEITHEYFAARDEHVGRVRYSRNGRRFYLLTEEGSPDIVIVSPLDICLDSRHDSNSFSMELRRCASALEALL